jgi:phosphoribosyl-ATP pyrophosphohydrolase/phosphoribosyl-AMP cyclohydrolase
MSINEIKFDEKGLVPAVVQDYKTGEVLMQAYMNRESLQKTIETGRTWFYSRSRQQLWEKGATSGNIQEVKALFCDCDGDSLLVKVAQTGPACHTGSRSCYYRSLLPAGAMKSANIGEVIENLYSKVGDRKENPVSGSYTCYLFEKGIDKILKKVGEESAEVIIAAKNESKDEMVYEISDLVYHLTVLMNHAGIYPRDIASELLKRSG